MAEPGSFFGAAAEAMRRILIEKARRRQAAKRGGGWERLDLDHVEIATETEDDTLLAVDEALEKTRRDRFQGRGVGQAAFLRWPDPRGGGQNARALRADG